MTDPLRSGSLVEVARYANELKSHLASPHNLDDVLKMLLSESQTSFTVPTDFELAFPMWPGQTPQSALVSYILFPEQLHKRDDHNIVFLLNLPFIQKRLAYSAANGNMEAMYYLWVIGQNHFSQLCKENLKHLRHIEQRFRSVYAELQTSLDSNTDTKSLYAYGRLVDIVDYNSDLFYGHLLLLKNRIEQHGQTNRSFLSFPLYHLVISFLSLTMNDDNLVDKAKALGYNSAWFTTRVSGLRKRDRFDFCWKVAGGPEHQIAEACFWAGKMLVDETMKRRKNDPSPAQCFERASRLGCLQAYQLAGEAYLKESNVDKATEMFDQGRLRGSVLHGGVGGCSTRPPFDVSVLSIVQ